MDYQCAPDIDRHKDLTANSVRLFQRFKQEADRQTLETLLDEEVARHTKLCELAILYYASSRYYWALLPRHPIQDVNTWTFRHLEEMGFKIEHRTTGRQRDVESDLDRSRRLTAVEVEHCTTANWFHHTGNDGEDISAEWQRREALEDENRSKNPPRPTSVIVDGEIKEANAVWAATLDRKYVVEVQRINGRNFLCVFDMTNRSCLHCEHTNVTFGAMFGPDAGDVAEWQDRAMKIIDSANADSG
ncbi:MAG: hypothetical protein IAE82_06520 [Opitutaceae bacterium]|nr:hypothetical protein [Opitutaceae bacterium]